MFEYVPKKPGLTTIKTLFAVSCNRCAFPGCDLRLTDPSWNGVKADIAHIRGEQPGASRYAPEMTDDERNSIDNLMLLCPNHHREIDRLQPLEWPAERLMQLKVQHEADCEDKQWANDGYMEHFASLLLSMDAESDVQLHASPPPRLVIQDGNGDSFEAVNIGEVDAFNVRVENATDGEVNGLLHLEDGAAKRLSPGARWRAGLSARSMGGGENPVVRLVWENDEGTTFDAEFPL